MLFAATCDDHNFGSLKRGFTSLSVQGRELLRFEVDGRHFQHEKALMLLEIYRHNGAWRVAAIGEGFSGGLRALLESLGGEVLEDGAPEDPTPAPRPHEPSWSPLVSGQLPSPTDKARKACAKCGKVENWFSPLDLNAEGLCSQCAAERVRGYERFRVRFQMACSDSILSLEEWQDLQNTLIRDQLDAHHALNFVRPDALRLLERSVALARAEGDIGQHTEEDFYRLAKLLEIPKSMYAPMLAELQELKEVSQIRAGRLPTITTSALLEAGEIAHLEAPATYRQVNAKSVKHLPGRLLLTSKGLHFFGPHGGWSVAYSKVYRIEEVPGGVNIELNIKHAV